MSAAAEVIDDDELEILHLGRKTLRPLNDQEKVFVAEYLVCFNARKAARKAGYSTSVANIKAHVWVRPGNTVKPHVAFAIQAAVEHRTNELTVTASKVVAELAKIGFSNMHDFIGFDVEGQPVINLDNMTRDKAAAIKKVKIKEYVEGGGPAAREVREVTLELYDKKGALVELGKHVGLFGAKPDAPAPSPIEGATTVAGVPTDADGNPLRQLPAGVVINNFAIELIPSGQHFHGEDGKLIDGQVILAELEKAEAEQTGYRSIDYEE